MHHLFRDNLGTCRDHQKGGVCAEHFSALKPRGEQGTFDTLLYLAINVFHLSDWKLRVMLCFRVVMRRTFDKFVEVSIARKLIEVLDVPRIVYLIRKAEGEVPRRLDSRPDSEAARSINDCSLITRPEALFCDAAHRTDEDKEERRLRAINNFQDFLRPLLQNVMDQASFNKGTSLVFDSLQNPVINKQVLVRHLTPISRHEFGTVKQALIQPQLAFALFDVAIGEVFPEILQD